MGLTGDSDDSLDTAEQRFDELCLDLNMDSIAKEDSWQSYQRISTNYTLEGDSIHWLACALYHSCRKTLVPTVGKGMVEGNCVSLTRLLRSTKLSLIEFFKKMKKWADMANLPQEFRDKVEKLERNFAVSTVIFKKFEPIFIDIFLDPANCAPRPPRSRKQKKLPCNVADVFKYCWTMFVYVKGNFPAISDDLVNSYHLLLCCIDWFYANALLSNRTDLINNRFSGLPKSYNTKDYRPPSDVPCIIQLLCEKHDGLQLEAKGIKEHWWKPHLKKLFDKKVLKGKMENVTGILELGTFETNSKAINHSYEEYVLNVGDFDERIFLGDDASVKIGTPAKMGPTVSGEISDRMSMQRVDRMQAHIDESRTLAPSTPLTGRRYLKEPKEHNITPVSTATQSVSKLQTLLSGRQTSPSDALKDIFKQCSRNPEEDIIKRVKEMGKEFCTKFAQPSDDHPGSLMDFAMKRLQLGESLYYKALETTMMNEKHKRGASKDAKPADFSNLLEQDVFHQSLFACCLEIVIFSYNSQRTFPWIVDVFSLQPYCFYKVIELLIRAEEGLSRDVVKHLNHIEETILESHAWKTDSSLWEAIKQSGSPVPSVEEVSLPSQIEKDGQGGIMPALQSPLQHPALRRVVATRAAKPNTPGQSPTGPTLSDRFNSPAPGSAKRRLFSTGPVQGSASVLSPAPTEERASTATASPAAGSQTPKEQSVVLAQTPDGRQVLIPVSLVQQQVRQQAEQREKQKESEASSTPGGSQVSATSSQSASSAQTSNKPKRTGSLALFFRKVYHLASVRLRDMCERLEIDSELRSVIWTCFEHTLMQHTELMKERHLDQLVMCAIYVMSKVTGKDQSFQDIMKCYRMQPQAQSHVYRSVLLHSRKRRGSGSSDSSKNGASGSSSPLTIEEKEKEKKESLIKMRSSSTLPVPAPNSQPPTPTRLAGTGSSFEFEDRGEDRGDLIRFYNQLFIKKVKTFALKFSSTTNNQESDRPMLSPLPVVRSQTGSPRRVSTNHSVYVSPHKIPPNLGITPQSKMLYCFNRSPAKDLRAINNMLRMNDRTGISGKRLTLGEDAEKEEVPAKRICVGGALNRKIQDVMNERQATNGAR